MQNLFLAYLEAPGPEGYRALRSALVRHPAYDPSSGDLDDLEFLYEKKRHAELQARFDEAKSNLLLSPRAHVLAGMTARDLGDNDTFEAERHVYLQCIAGIQGTGDGSELSPYLIARPSDADDLLLHLGRQIESEERIQRDERTYDVMTCDNGSAVWFNVTDACRRQAEQEGEGK